MSELHVIFGSGPLGRWTASNLLQMGKTIRMINRSGRMLDPLPGVEVIASDAYDAQRNIEITREAAAIYQFAQPPYHEWVAKFPALQGAILQAAIRNAAKLVVADNLYMYGAFSGILVEDAPVRPVSRKGRVRAEMAREIQEAQAAGKVRAAVGRASDFFGPYDTALTGYTFQPVVRGRAANLVGRADQPHSFTYVPDFGRLLAALGTREEALGQVWFAPTNPPLTQAELIGLAEEALRHPVKKTVGSAWLLRLLGLFNRDVAEMTEMIYEWDRPFVIDSSKAEKAFGLQPTPMKQAIQETLDWCLKMSPKN